MFTKEYRDYPYGLLDQIFSQDEITYTEEVIKNLEEEIEKLSDTERRIILLRFKEKKLIKEIGDVVSLSYGNTSQRIQRILIKLKHPVTKQQIAGSEREMSEFALENYPFSIRTYHTLKRNGIQRMDQIQSVKHLSKLHGIGKTAIREVTNIAKKNGLDIRKD